MKCEQWEKKKKAHSCLQNTPIKQNQNPPAFSRDLSITDNGKKMSIHINLL